MTEQSKKRSRSVMVRVSALVGTLIVILSVCVMPVSAGVWDNLLEDMPVVELNALGDNVSRTHVVSMDAVTDDNNRINLQGYTKEKPFYFYFRVDRMDYETFAEVNAVVNFQFAFFNSSNYASFRIGSGAPGGEYINDVSIRKTTSGSTVKLKEYSTFYIPPTRINEIFLAMWYNETTDQLVVDYVVHNEFGDVLWSDCVFVPWGGKAPQMRFNVAECHACVRYAWGADAYRFWGLADVQRVYLDGYNYGHAVGMQAGQEDAYDRGYQEGNDIGYDVGMKDGYDLGVSEGFTEGKNEGYLAGFNEGSKDAVGSLVQYAEEQGITFVDASNSIADVYKAIKDKGWTEAVDQGTLTTKLIWTALEAPINVVLGSANFEVFGINFAGITFSILAGVIVLFILRVIVDIVV